MEYGLCTLNAVALRSEPDYQSALTSQLLFGETFQILESANNFIRVTSDYDDHTGWVSANQIQQIGKSEYLRLFNAEKSFSNELVSYLTERNNMLTPVSLGAIFPDILEHEFRIHDKTFYFEGESKFGVFEKKEIVKTAFLYLNAPFSYGGRTPFGIDADALTQMVYKINGHFLPRKATDQAKQGEVLSFIEESEPGDLAFFDDEEGNIIHTGILLDNYYIIHSYGKVRLDRLDQSGIFNVETKRHTHQLRMIKKII